MNDMTRDDRPKLGTLSVWAGEDEYIADLEQALAVVRETHGLTGA